MCFVIQSACSSTIGFWLWSPCARALLASAKIARLIVRMVSFCFVAVGDIYRVENSPKFRGRGSSRIEEAGRLRRENKYTQLGGGWGEFEIPRSERLNRRNSKILDLTHEYFNGRGKGPAGGARRRTQECWLFFLGGCAMGKMEESEEQVASANGFSPSPKAPQSARSNSGGGWVR